MYIFLLNLALAGYVLWEQVRKEPFSRRFDVCIYGVICLFLVLRFGLCLLYTSDAADEL